MVQLLIAFIFRYRDFNVTHFDTGTFRRSTPYNNPAICGWEICAVCCRTHQRSRGMINAASLTITILSSSCTGRDIRTKTSFNDSFGFLGQEG